MVVKNIMEGLVSNLIESVVSSINDPVVKTSKFKLDLLCYVLNRVKPRYYISSRGIVHGEIIFSRENQIIADIITLIHEGINTIKDRRKEEFIDDKSLELELGPKKDDKYYFNFPLIIGKVLDASNFAPLSGVKVSLLTGDSELVEMANPLWINPYIIPEKIQGIYSFWPKPIQADEKKVKERKFDFILRFEHKDYLKEEKIFFLVIKSENMVYNFIRKDISFNLDPVYLERR